MDDIKTLKRTDYTRYLRPRTPAPNDSVKASAPSGPPGDPDQITVSVRIQLPNYVNWRIYIFIRQYPYLFLVSAVLAGLCLLLLAGGLSFMWHETLGLAATGRGK